jgi:hypothetical protein
MLTTMTQSGKFDFEDDRFKDLSSEVLPWCQMINPQYSQDGLKPYGLAISLEKANMVGFTPDENWQQVEYTFGSGEATRLFITTTPRLLVVRRGPVCIKDRATGITLGRLADHYDAFMTEKLKFKTFTRYLIFLVGQNQKLLHQSPLRLTMSGAAGASFGEAFRRSRAGFVAGGFTVELEKAYAAYRQQLFTSKGALFHAHGIFCPIIDSVEKGMGQKALVATTVDYGHPTAENLTEYLIASTSPESGIICQTFEDYKDFAKEQPKPENSKIDMEQAPGSFEFQDEYDFDQAPY